MIIEDAILHITDADNENLICTKQALDLSQPNVYQYLEKLTQKWWQTDAKSGQLPETSQVVQILQYPDFDFVARSIELVNLWFALGRGAEDLPLGDYVVEQFEEEGKHYLALFKLTHKQGFTHYLDYQEEEIVNQLVENRNLLPAPTAKLDEAMMIEIETMNYRLVEKAYKIDGKKRFYLSEDFLQVTSPKRSVNESLKEMKKVVKEMAKDDQEEEYVASAKLQQALYETVEEDGMLNTKAIGEQLYQGQPEKKAKYQEKMEELALVDQPIMNPAKLAERYYKQKFKLDNGIEISIPMDVYQDKEAVEFINQPDGSLSVVIKNIDEIKNRF